MGHFFGFSILILILFLTYQKKKKKIIDGILLVDFFKLLTYRDEDATRTRALLNLLVW